MKLNTIYEYFAISTFGVCIFFGLAKGRYVAISSLIGREKYYIEPWYIFYEPNEDITFEKKADICADIVGSPLFTAYHKVDLLDPFDEAVYTNLKENYPSIYKDLYEEQNSSTEITFKNSYVQRDVIVRIPNHKHIVHEYVFTCLAADRATRAITEYFVSRPHRVNDMDYDGEDDMKGRFVSMYASNEKQELAVIALAEEPGYAIDPSHNRYNESLMVGFENEVLEGVYEQHEIGDTVCGLPIHQKIRLCTLVLNAEGIRKEVKFVPNEDNVDPECHRGVIRFHNVNNTVERVENDWMIACKAQKAGNRVGSRREFVIYYISAGFQSLDYFICNTAGSKKTILGGTACRIAVPKKVEFRSFLPVLS